MMTDQQLHDRMGRIAFEYPGWMDLADSVGVARFRELVKRAALLRQRPQQEKGKPVERWRQSATSVIERFESLERNVRERRRIGEVA